MKIEEECNCEFVVPRRSRLGSEPFVWPSIEKMKSCTCEVCKAHVQGIPEEISEKDWIGRRIYFSNVTKTLVNCLCDFCQEIKTFAAKEYGLKRVYQCYMCERKENLEERKKELKIEEQERKIAQNNHHLAYDILNHLKTYKFQRDLYFIGTNKMYSQEDETFNSLKIALNNLSKSLRTMYCQITNRDYKISPVEENIFGRWYFVE